MASPVPARPPAPRAPTATSAFKKKPQPAPKADVPEKVTSSRDPASRDGLRSQFNKGPVNDAQTRAAVDTNIPTKPTPAPEPAPSKALTVFKDAQAKSGVPAKADSIIEGPNSTSGPSIEMADNSGSASRAMVPYKDAAGGEGATARSMWEGADLGGPGGAIKMLGRVAGPAAAFDILHNLGWFDNTGTKPGYGNTDWKAGGAPPSSAPPDQPSPMSSAKDLYSKASAGASARDAAQQSSSRSIDPFSDVTGYGAKDAAARGGPIASVPPYRTVLGDVFLDGGTNGSGATGSFGDAADPVNGGPTQAFGPGPVASAPPADAVDVRAAAVAKTDKGSKADKSAPASASGKGVQTKGGFYPIFDKGSKDATDFEDAYKGAQSGNFDFQGRSYSKP